ncbi:comEA protein [Enterococcus moraviensis]|nr:comEA protein [Enterococcus moraviensis]
MEKPGIYEGHLQMRVWDVVMLAGGVKDDADTKQVNFAERIKDQMVIYVPKVGEEVQHNEKSTDSQISQSDTVDKVNLNQATETELQTLSGVGQKKAQEIIRYREENGGFKSIDDLKNISGFGEKTVEKLKEFITV